MVCFAGGEHSGAGKPGVGAGDGERPPTHYELLGLEESACSEAVRAAYLRAAARAHPDRARARSAHRPVFLTLTRPAQGGAAEAFTRVKAAYEALRAYDESLQAGAGKHERGGSRAGGAARTAQFGLKHGVSVFEHGQSGPAPASRRGMHVAAKESDARTEEEEALRGEEEWTAATSALAARYAAEGAEALQAGHAQAAVAAFTQALRALGACGEGTLKFAQLYERRAKAYSASGDEESALVDRIEASGC